MACSMELVNWMEECYTAEELPKLPNDIIMSIIKQADGGRTAHKNKLKNCLEEMLEKYQAEISIYPPDHKYSNATESLAQILKKYNVEAEVYTYQDGAEACKMWWSDAFNLPEEIVEEDNAYIDSPFEDL